MAGAGLPFEVAEIGLGHTLKGMAGKYTKVSDDQIREAFCEIFTRCLQRNQDLARTHQEKSVGA